MQLVAKVASDAKQLKSAKNHKFSGKIAISPGEHIALSISPNMVTGYTREGSDLVVHLTTGETVRIENFYATSDKPSHLYLVDSDQQLVAAELNPASDGMISAIYTPQGVAADFASIGASGGGLGTAGIIGGALLGGGGIAAAAGGGGGDNDTTGTPDPNDGPVQPVDTTAPGAATGLAVNAAGTTLTGNAEPGATVRIDVNGDGAADYTATVGADGHFTVPLQPPLVNNETISVIVRDAAGNASPPATVHAPDATAPQPATDVQVSPDGTDVTGTAEPGSTVGVDTNGDGVPDATATAGPDGSFTIPLDPPLTNGETVTVIVTDPSGNDSTPVTATAPDTTAPAPASDVSISPDGTTLTGTAEPGATVGVDTNGDGTPDTTVTTDPDGGFTAPLDPPLTNGETVTVIVTDPAGNDSAPVTTTAPDTTAPLPATGLTVSPDGTALTGTAEPGATVNADTNGDGVADATTTADTEGNFSIPLDPPLVDGETIAIIVVDEAGNASDAASVVAPDLIPPPPAPVLNPSNGTEISGTAEPGSTVSISADGAPLGQVTADANGDWTFAPPSPLADGTVVSAVASNSEGEPGPAASVTVDAVAPATPVIDPSNGAELSGIAEPGSTVTLTDGNGAPIGTTTADGSGNWTFTPSPALADGTVVDATATDAAGNASGPATVTVDVMAPATPVIEPSNGSELSGTAEPGSTVALTDGSGAPIGTATADGSGNWTFTPSPALADGTVVTATATDAAGNASAPATVTVDAVPPAAPTIDPSNGTALTGTAEPGSIVTLTDGSGNPIATVTADGSGNWGFTPTPALADGTVVNATATDAAGNASPAANATVDAQAPAAPVIDPSNGIELTGTAEPGAQVVLVLANGTPIGTAAVDADGNWTFEPATPLPDGTVVEARAIDPTGNVGPASAATIDAQAPAAPVLDPSNGSVLTGTAEPGSIVTLTDGSGNPIGQATADNAGDWTFSPSPALADGTVVDAVATDAAGNASTPATLTVDALPPATPVIEPSNGAVLAGTAEPGSTVTLTDGNGDPIGQAVTDSAGNWTFQPATQLADGTVVNATATDAAGNVSPEATATIDASLPSIPTIDPSNGAIVSGTADPGDTVTVSVGGVEIGQTIADGSGNWSVTPATQLADGTVVSAIATNPLGADSAPAAMIVDAVAPAAPTITPTDGTELSGTAEPGATVTLTDGGGNPIGQATADSGGHWTFPPSPALAD
uniref:Ig-like domain-containing protein n=1 Tax=Sphingomonas sp. dw_22 TaxID=2721175 RepID=UPI002116FC67